MYVSKAKATTGVFLLVLTLFLAGCAGQTPQQSPPKPDDTYIIGPGDLLDIQVWKEPDLTRVARVRIDGMISIPLIDDVQAAGVSPLALKKTIEDRLQGFVEVPKVTVIVNESSHRVYITGRVPNPGQYPLNKDLTVLEALTLAGGPSEWADSNGIVIMRRVGGEVKRIPFEYKKVVSGKKLGQNVYLQPNDTIIVP
ncbi:MAG: polysaccharide biosynthesis/export family protein [Pseudomonadota bacterium]